MKKSIKFLFVLGLVLGLIGIVNAQQVAVWVEDVTAAPGESIQVPVNTEELTAAMNVMFYQFQLSYDAAIATATAPSTAGTITPPNWSPTWNINNPGEIIGGAWGFVNSMTGAGILVYLNFDIDPNATSGTYPLEFEYFMYSTTGTPEAVTTDGSITISAALPEIEDLVISIDNEDILLNWSSVSGAVSYNIYRSSVAYFEPITVYDQTNTNSYVDAGALSTGPWFYIVTSEN